MKWETSEISIPLWNQRCEKHPDHQGIVTEEMIRARMQGNGMSIEAMKLALEALEKSMYPQKKQFEAIAALRQAIEQAEQREDAYLFYAPGDVLICKESYERVVVKHGNTGPIQLTNGKIALEWSDEVYGEYTLEQVMDGFIREGYAPRIKQAEQAEQAEQAQPVAWQWLDTGTFRKRLPKTAEPGAWNPLYTAPPQRKPLTDEEIMNILISSGRDEKSFARAIEAAHGIKQ